MPRGWTLTIKLRRDDPDIRLLVTDSLLDALLAVLNRRADATIVSQTAVYYLCQQNTLGGLNSIVQNELKNMELSMLVNKNEPVLYGIVTFPRFSGHRVRLQV